MVPSLWKGLVGIGLFVLVHEAFSTAQRRSCMRSTEKEDESLPIDIVLQTLLAFAVTFYGIVRIAGEFKDLDATSELKNKTFDTLRNHSSFYVFNHHVRVLFQSSDPVTSSNQDALSSGTSLTLRKLESLLRPPEHHRKVTSSPNNDFVQCGLRTQFENSFLVAEHERGFYNLVC
ncbi:LOW QUALITY PROTEIN: ER membrane protein complex subunit 5-like [Suncus etruscus]|uniref:LOW QUALITY PROTEIN: ER membrane protein complex subunit 5-like n=1 Tax=Suncus etruscus TaxID=109475 RepID=UPI0021106132|nr:LOW QUALITY PROTEIN: ER membrane protein complex subunit 5-like [Suncus etruscus]